MRLYDIRRAVGAWVANLGYAEEHYRWPKPGRLNILIDDALQCIYMPAPLPKYRFRDIMRGIPRRGPSRPLRRRVSADGWRQPSMDELWAA